MASLSRPEVSPWRLSLPTERGAGEAPSVQQPLLEHRWRCLSLQEVCASGAVPCAGHRVAVWDAGRTALDDPALGVEQVRGGGGAGRIS